MKRNLILLAIVCLINSSGILAAPISPETALERIPARDNFLLTVDGAPNTRSYSQSQPKLIKTFSDSEGTPALYIFDQGNREGFLVVSADDVAAPLLGYSDKGEIDPDNMPPALTFWLQQYQKQIDYARETGLATRSSYSSRAGVALPNWSAILPLVKTQWNQDAPFNNQCPLYQGERCVTGCVATSMSQAMKYFNWPTTGSGSITYTSYYPNASEPTVTIKDLNLDFSKINFDWANMIDDYSGNYTTAQGNAVAQLMQAAGYAVQMGYSPDESGAASGRVAGALVNYFNYDKSIRYYLRDQFEYVDWATLIYNNLKNVGPVIYDGTGDAGGHSWICDGYQGGTDGYFHFNWGWGGVSDGYYLLDALDPSVLGIGGGSGGFVFDQGAIINMQKPTNSSNTQEQEELAMTGSLQGTIASGTALLTLKPVGGSTPGWSFIGLNSLTFQLGAAIVPADNPNASPKFMMDYKASSGDYSSLSPQYYIPAQYGPTINLNLAGLTQNTDYLVYSAYRTTDKVIHLMPCGVGDYNYVKLNYSKSKFTVTNMAPMALSASSISFQNNLYTGTAVKVNATITNSNNISLSKGVGVALYNSNKTSTAKAIFTGDAYYLTVGAGSSADAEWLTTWTQQSGSTLTSATNYYPGIYDENTGNALWISSTPVTMYPESQNNVTSSSKIVVQDATYTEGYTVDAYELSHPSNFTLLSTVTVTGGSLARQLYVAIGPNDSQGISAYSTFGNGVTTLNAGQSASSSNTFSLPNAQVGEIYVALVGYLDGSTLKQLDSSAITGIIITDTNSGIEAVALDNSEINILYNQSASSLDVIGGERGVESVEAYFINGIKAPVDVQYQNGCAHADLSDLGKGIIVVTATDKAGNRKSMKIVL